MNGVLDIDEMYIVNWTRKAEEERLLVYDNDDHFG